MIRPKPQPGTAMPKGIAVVLTGALLVAVQVGLAGIPLPALASGRSVIRELDPLMLERFAVPPAPEATADEAEAPEEVTPEAEEPASLSFDDEVGAAMEQLEELFAEEDQPVAVGDRAGADAEGASSDAPGIAADVPDDRFESLFGAGGPLVAGGAGARRSGSARPGAGGLGVGIEERRVDEEPEAAATDAPGPDVAVRPSTAREGVAAGEELEIETHDPESFDESSAARLGRWMRENPAELPVGVRVHMNYEPSFLTSATEFVSDGRSYELYLMFNEALREVHVVLVDGARSAYLIDRGFQEQSRSLREGSVRRDGGRIVAIDSRSGAASGDLSREFYDVFLSWWASIGGEAGA